MLFLRDLLIDSKKSRLQRIWIRRIDLVYNPPLKGPMSILLCKRHFHIGTCTLIVVTIERSTDLLDISLRHSDRELPVDLNAK